MRYASIRELDISNGEGLGVALFTQGCSRHCFNCFNPETWDFNDGKEWTSEIEEKFFNLLNHSQITRLSILGGEPLADKTIKDINRIVTYCKLRYPNKKIWLYTGNTLEDADFGKVNESTINSNYDAYWYDTIHCCDIIVDGPYMDDLRDLTLAFRGSSNQRIIDVRKSLKKGEIVIWKN